MKTLSLTHSDVVKIVNYLSTMNAPTVVVYLNGVKCIASLENEIVLLSLQIRYEEQLSCIKVDDNLYLVCRPY